MSHLTVVVKLILFDCFCLSIRQRKSKNTNENRSAKSKSVNSVNERNVCVKLERPKKRHDRLV